MAFGISRAELTDWKRRVSEGEIAFLTHYWLDPRFPNVKSVTKVGCANLKRLEAWCKKHGLNPAYIHNRTEYPHYDLMGTKQLDILKKESLHEHVKRFKL